MDIDTSLRDIALLLSRLTLGGSIASHGAQKMFGVLGGPGLKATAESMESLGFSPGGRYAPMVAATEMTSGMLMMLGAFGPVAPAMLLSVMVVAIETVHKPKGYFAQNGGYEMNTMYILNAVLLANEGYGAYSVDEMLAVRTKLRPIHGWLTLLAGAAGAMLVLSQRSQSGGQQSAEKSAHKNETAATDSEIGAAV
ncbi:MAG: DoxX family protein [Candidatus Baltobacteraceae bacterium]